MSFEIHGFMYDNSRIDLIVNGNFQVECSDTMRMFTGLFQSLDKAGMSYFILLTIKEAGHIIHTLVAKDLVAVLMSIVELLQYCRI